MRTERRMALLFVVVLGLLVWQATRLERLRPPPVRIAADPAHQIYPVAVPPGEPPVLPPEGESRRLALERRSVAWPEGGDATAAPGSPCRLFIPVSTHHWVRRPVDTGAYPDRARLAVSPRDLLDDDDGDGDLLDAGELVPAPAESDSGTRVSEVHCTDAAR